MTKKERLEIASTANCPDKLLQMVLDDAGIDYNILKCSHSKRYITLSLLKEYFVAPNEDSKRIEMHYLLQEMGIPYNKISDLYSDELEQLYKLIPLLKGKTLTDVITSRLPMNGVEYSESVSKKLLELI